MSLKNTFNRFLQPFKVEVHGKGYIQKLRKSSIEKNAFERQFELLGRDAKVIFDVGANRGDVTLKYRKRYPKAFIHAFEPIEDFRLIFNEKMKGDSDLKLNHIALSNQNGQSIFHINSDFDTSSLLESTSIGARSDESCRNVKQISVTTLRLDDYCADQNIESIDILKLDTQGSELSILMGGEQLLKSQGIKIIYTECYFQQQYKEQPLFYEIATYLKQFGYFLEDIYNPYYNDQFILWSDAIFIK